MVKRKTRTRTKTHKPDPVLIILTFALVFIGIVMIATSGIIQANRMFDGKNDYFFFTRQVIWATLGFVSMYITAQIPYTFWKKNALPLLLFGLLFSLTVFIPGLSKGEVNGVYRWIQIGPVNAQPSEFIKLLIPIYLAAWLSQKKRHDIQDLKYGFLPFFILLGLVVILLKSDLSTTIVIIMTSLVIFFLSGASILQMSMLFTIALSVGLILIRVAPYRVKRFTTFLRPFEDMTGAGYHINQALLALGSGGLFGLGFGHSRQKYGWLPYPVTDSIFAIIGEEFGLLGTLFIIAMFLLFTYRAFNIAMHAPDGFSRLLACAVAFWIPFQALVNIGAMVSIIPLTGIPLPFVSYGGSSLLVTLTAVGILLNISKHADYEKPFYTSTAQRRGNRRTSLASRRAH